MSDDSKTEVAQGSYDEPELPTNPGIQPVAEVAPDPSAGDTVGSYRLLSELGKGGAGTVFKAQHLETGETIAMKVLSASKVKRARVVERFFDEVRAAGSVKHPGLIQIHDFIEQVKPRRLAYAMEFLEGEMLRARLRREKSLDLRIAIHISMQICDALAALHEHGIVHRDLKPENIMLVRSESEDGMPNVKLLDFGVVKFLPVDRTTQRTDEKPGTFVGTPRYMAPEQAAGAVVDGRADLFAVGVMLFEMITGRCPHEGDSLRDVVLAKLKGAPRITLNPENEILPQELTEVVDACLRLKPHERPPNAATVAAGLREAEFVLFAVGAMKASEDGSTIREATDSSDLEPVEDLPDQPPMAPVEVSEEVAIEPEPEPAHEPVAVQPRSRSRTLLMVLLLIMVVAAIAIALIVRRLKTEDPVLLVPVEAPVTDQPRSYEVLIDTTPSGARVLSGDNLIGTTPLRVEIAAKEERRELMLELDGHQRKKIAITRQTPKGNIVRLSPLQAETATSGAETATTP